LADGFSAIDEVLGILVQRREHHYAFDVDRERQQALFTRASMQARVSLAQGGRIRVAYESAPHELVEELCTSPAQAAALIIAVMARERLCRVPKPDAEPVNGFPRQ